MDETYLVFAGETGGGNPAGVAFVSSLEDEAALRARAREANLPVCAFIQRGTRVAVRFFTRSAELPFCGHGALAAAAAIMARSGEGCAVFQVGAREVLVAQREDLCVLTATEAWVRDEVPVSGALLGALGISADLITRANIASIGSTKAILEVRDDSVLRRLSPNFEALADWSRGNQVNGAFVYALGADGRPLARAFNPAGGNNEDAATGVAVGALAWTLDHPRGSWLHVTQVGAQTEPCELYVRRLEGLQTEIGGRVRKRPRVQQ